jgi:hypothetical protein
MTQPSFDRVRARGTGERGPTPEAPGAAPVDVQGKSALFSGAPVTPSFGSVVITCSLCQNATVVSYPQALRLALPSLHLPIVRRGYPSWMRCPVCQHHRWVRLRFR